METLKNAILIKQSGLDDIIPSSYRLASNMPFLSKVLERVIHRQTIAYLVEHNLLSVVPAAYWRDHSNEATLLKVISGLIDAMDSGLLVILLLLDSTTAFDIVNHDISYIGGCPRPLGKSRQ